MTSSPNSEQDGSGNSSNNLTTPNGTTTTTTITFPEFSQDSTTSNNHFIPESPSYSEFSNATDTLPKSIDTLAHDTIFQGLTEEEVLQIDELGDNDSMIDRYIRACGGDMQLALRRIKDTLAWLRVEKPREMVCSACLEKDPTSHYMHVVGHDIYKRPVIYSCLALASNRNVEDNRVHMLSTFENAILLMPRVDDAEGGECDDGPSSAICSWVWIMDMHGFGFKDCSPQLARIFLNLSAAHYPERLGQFLVIGAPSIFSTLWKAVQPFIDINTRKKIHFRDFDYKPHKENKGGKLKPLLEEYFDQDMVEWLLEEMKENRDKEKGKGKHYDYRALANVAVGGMEHDEVMREVDGRRRGSLSGSHDNLGTEAYLKMMGTERERILPGLLKLSTLPLFTAEGGVVE